MPCPLLNPNRLAIGIAKFLHHPKWRQDFHNRFYQTVTHASAVAHCFQQSSVGGYKVAGHFGRSLWHDILGELQFWKALRPYSTANFHAPQTLAQLDAAYRAFPIAIPYAHQPATNPPQCVIEDLFLTAATIKPGTQPSIVFASKCCHMLVPWEYPIWDNSFVGNANGTRTRMQDALHAWEDLDPLVRQRMRTDLNAPGRYPFSYWVYREFILLAWDTLPVANQNTLMAQLNAAIAAGTPSGGMGVYRHYPYRTRIAELCLA